MPVVIAEHAGLEVHCRRRGGRSRQGHHRFRVVPVSEMVGCDEGVDAEIFEVAQRAVPCLDGL